MEFKQPFIQIVAIVVLLLGITACNENLDPIAQPGVPTLPLADFPTGVGMKWIYSVYDSLTGQTDTALVSIAGTTELTNHTPARFWISTRRLSHDTMFVVVRGNTVEFYDTQSSIDPEVFIFPLEVGASWGTGTDTNTVVGIDVIEAPFGTFNESFHVLRRASGLNYGKNTHTWFAPHLGIVIRTRDEYDFGPPVKDNWLLISQSE